MDAGRVRGKPVSPSRSRSGSRASKQAGKDVVPPTTTPSPQQVAQAPDAAQDAGSREQNPTSLAGTDPESKALEIKATEPKSRPGSGKRGKKAVAKDEIPR